MSIYFDTLLLLIYTYEYAVFGELVVMLFFESEFATQML